MRLAVHASRVSQAQIRARAAALATSGVHHQSAGIEALLRTVQASTGIGTGSGTDAAAKQLDPRPLALPCPRH